MLANTQPIHPLPPNSALLFSLLEEKRPFFELIRCTRDLIFGFLADCPIGDGNVMKTAYIASKHEEEWNAKHEDAVACALRVFDAMEGPALRAKDLAAYDDRRYRIIFEKEVESLFTELETEYPGKDCGYIQLKREDETYQSRCLQVFLNSEPGATQQDADELLAANDVMLLRRDVCCDDALSGGRSVLGKFSHTVVSPFIHKKATAILQNEGPLEQIPTERRNIVWINSLYNLLANVNTILYGGVIKTIALQLETIMEVAIEPLEPIPNSAEIRPEVCEQLLPELKKRLTKLIEAGTFPDTFRSQRISLDNVTFISEFVDKFFTECDLVYSSLSLFLAILHLELQVAPTPLETDFARLTISPRQSLRKSAGPEYSPRYDTPRRSLNRSSPSIPDVTLSTPRSPRPQPLSSPRQSPCNSPRATGSSLSSPRTLLNPTKGRSRSSTIVRDSISPTGSPRKVATSQELYLKRQAYYNALVNTLEVFKRLARNSA